MHIIAEGLMRCEPLHLYPNTRMCFAAVALAYEAQVVESVPVSPHDRPIDVLITSTRTQYMHR